MKLDSQFACFKPPSKKEQVPLEQLLASFSPQMAEVAMACLQPDASKRATAEQLMQLEFFQGVQDVLPAAVRCAPGRRRCSGEGPAGNRGPPRGAFARASPCGRGTGACAEPSTIFLP